MTRFIKTSDGSVLCVRHGRVECVINAKSQHDNHVAAYWEHRIVNG